jgi:hypothetical protein
MRLWQTNASFLPRQPLFRGDGGASLRSGGQSPIERHDALRTNPVPFDLHLRNLYALRDLPESARAISMFSP